MSAHTPGPWSVVVSVDVPQIRSPRNTWLASVDSKANARLIAAAPDLLAVCEQLLARVCKECADPDDLPEVFQARAAIKKARGE